jgi:hypothetical protein
LTIGVLKLFFRERDSFFPWGRGDSGWVANSLSHCCQMRVLELSYISFRKKRKCRTRALKKRMCNAHGGSLRNAYKILVDIVEPRAERTRMM